MKSIFVGVFLSIAFSLSLALRAYSYDVIYHQDLSALTVDQTCNLLPPYETKVISTVGRAIGKMNLPKGTILAVTINQKGKIIGVTSQNSREKILARLRALSFGQIPFGVGPRTLLLTFKVSELGKALTRGNVQINAGT